jgi:plasmid stabilization system protein ParE
MARIVWTRKAITKLELVQAYIDLFDPIAGRRMAARLLAAGDSLRDFPERGRRFSDVYRELVTVRPYILRYRVGDGAVYIVDIVHAAQLRDAE